MSGEPPVRYVTVTADPPWPWDDRLRMSAVKRGSEDQYGKMTIEEIKALYTPSNFRIGSRPRVTYSPSMLVGHPLADIGFCNLWTTATHLLNGNAQDVLRHWGYEPKQIVPWIKGEAVADHEHPDLRAAGVRLDTLGMGWVFRVCAEFLVVGTRGKYKDLVKRHDRAGLILDDLILAPRPPKRAGTKHSRKPPVAYSMIEAVMPGPYLELFAGDDAPAHWTRWGKPRPAAAGKTSQDEKLPVGADEIIHPDTEVEWPAPPER